MGRSFLWPRFEPASRKQARTTYLHAASPLETEAMSMHVSNTYKLTFNCSFLVKTLCSYQTRQLGQPTNGQPNFCRLQFSARYSRPLGENIAC